MKNILVAYATWTGTTKNIAEEIRVTLVEENHSVTLLPVGQVKSLENYDLVVLGTPIHAFHTMRNFRKFLRRYYTGKSTPPIAIFVSCANVIDDNQKNREETRKWLDRAISKYDHVNFRAIGLFAGAFSTSGEEFDNLNFLLKRIISLMAEKAEQDFGKTDFRDWEIIQSWSKQLVIPD